MSVSRSIITVVVALAGGACVVGEDTSEVVERFDGIVAASAFTDDRSGRELCEDQSCIVTRLTDAETGAPIATAVWNADTAVGEVTQDGLITEVMPTDYAGMTPDEANDLTYATVRSGAEADDPDSPYGSTCTVQTTNNGSCICVYVSCSICITLSDGEHCFVSGGTPSCYPLSIGYGGYCGATRDA